MKLKYKLMFQSLSPLALLTIVRNIPFAPVNEIVENHTCWVELSRLKIELIVVFVLCAVWFIIAVIFYVSFTAFIWTDKIQGYQIFSAEEKDDVSVNFFMTMIIPLLIDDVGTIQGLATFLIIVIMMLVLLCKTKLYYANPILAILGYRVYEVQFENNSNFGEEKCIALVKGGFSKKQVSVEYKVIDGTVLYMKEMKK